MMPNMAGALSLFGSRVQIQVVKMQSSDFEVVEAAPKGPLILASIQPMPARQLAIKSEGERALNWWNMWCREQIEVGQYIRDSTGKTYRIMQENNWMQSGYHQYELQEGTP